MTEQNEPDDVDPTDVDPTDTTDPADRTDRSTDADEHDGASGSGSADDRPTSDPAIDPGAYETVDIDPTIDVPYAEHPVCVPVAIFERESIPRALMSLLSPVPVVVLGYHVLPEQTPPGQARMQFEERAQRELDDIVTAFEDSGASGATVETRLAFTGDAEQTIERVALDDRCSAMLLVNPAPTIDHALLAVRDDRNVEQVVGLAATLLADTDINVTLYHVATSEAKLDRGEELVRAAAELLEANGISRDQIDTEAIVSDTPVRTLVSRADDDFDLIILGETEPTLRERIVGETPQRIADRSLEPVLIVRQVDEGRPTDD